MKISDIITLACLLAVFAIKIDLFDPAVIIDPVVVIDDPFPGEGKRLLIVYQTEDVDEMPYSQSLIFTSTVFRKYLDDNDIDFRFLDADVVPVSEPWKSAFALEREGLPWVFYSNGVNGFSKSLPGSREELQHNIDSIEVVK